MPAVGILIVFDGTRMSGEVNETPRRAPLLDILPPAARWVFTISNLVPRLGTRSSILPIAVFIVGGEPKNFCDLSRRR